MSSIKSIDPRYKILSNSLKILIESYFIYDNKHRITKLHWDVAARDSARITTI